MGSLSETLTMIRLLTVVCAVAAASAASAQGPDVAIVAAASILSNDCRLTNPQALLLATGFFDSVDIINASTGTPTLQDLLQYDAVLTWSNTTYNDSVLLGDTLADYVDAGGGVVVATFANSAADAGSRLQGRWAPNYEVIVGGSGQTQDGGPFLLGTINAPGHPLLAGVSSFAGGTSSYRPTVTALTTGSTSIAEWSDGRILVATGAQPSRVDLTFYPPSSVCRVDFWDLTTDGDLLMANALVFVAGSGVGLGTTYCSPGVANSTGSGGVIRATGSLVAAANDVTLEASSLPLNSFGFFLTSRTQGMLNQPGGCQGVLCLGGSIGRYVGPGQIKNSGATGAFSLDLDLAATPTPIGLVQIVAGETWNFQSWHRDAIGGVATSNFTDAVQLDFN
jgi:hypothetical protein